MIQITATDFKSNLGKYLTLASREEIHISKNGEEVAVLTAPKAKQNWLDDLVGIIPNVDMDVKEIKAERLAQKYENPKSFD